MKTFKTLIVVAVCLAVAGAALAVQPLFSADITITGDLYIAIGETTTLTATWSTNRDVNRYEWLVNGVSQDEIAIDGVDSGSATFNFTPTLAGTYQVCFHIWHHKQTDRDADYCVTVSVMDGFDFAGWRPPVSLAGPADGWKSGSTMPVKFLVVDAAGNPVTEGVNAYVSIGDSYEVPAEFDEVPGQWKAEIKLVGEGYQDVIIDGNVNGVDYLCILVKP
jgi:hypothetical protein